MSSAEPVEMWGPEWLVLPWGTAIVRATMEPCPCGEEVFDKYEPKSGRTRFIGCRRCIRPKSGDVLIGSVNMRNGNVKDFRGDSQPRGTVA